MNCTPFLICNGSSKFYAQAPNDSSFQFDFECYLRLLCLLSKDSGSCSTYIIEAGRAELSSGYNYCREALVTLALNRAAPTSISNMKVKFLSQFQCK
jgi:hypothetical protein